MTNYNGGFRSYDDKVTPQGTFFRAIPTYTKTVTVKQGQVLKKHSFVGSGTDGKVIAHPGLQTDPDLPRVEIAGVLLMDVDATAGDVEATVYTHASFWASALVWSVDVSTDKIKKADGTLVACTAYNTGASTDLLKRKFVENTHFEQLGILKAGEVY
jgi:hypothetical protein